MKQKLTGKKVAVTGASSGIGRATAIRMAKEGADVALIARNRERLHEVAEEIRALGRKAVEIEADITDAEGIKAAVQKAIDELGGLDVFHCNAGIYLRCPAKDLRMDQIRKIMEVDYFGCLNCVYAVLPYFLEKKSGSIVTTCSMDGKKGVPPDAAYVGAKFAMNGFFQVLRQELRGSGVHVGIIYPSRMDTPQIAHVDCPKITPKGDPDMVAKAVVKSVVKKKKEIMVPSFSCHLLTWADAISPSLSDWLVRVNRLDGTENEIEPINEAK
ncbi:MAG: SDR family oxidoreductase [Clostridia bacterium]|jgi:NADP-dependent 3-hydroxy acid dehydrogenase YdfG|nr:SDR family oxidoreductase [Clostridia bacterium]MBO7658396.1 SDR family oxidoreductase [Clostridia bacterium]MBP5664766.1 SDR family oxidoreductase [Clostridia bacterium]